MARTAAAPAPAGARPDSAPVLTPLAVSHADVLRYLDRHHTASAKAVAEGLGRVPSNVRRDLPKLEGEGLVETDGESWSLTPAGARTVRALERAEAEANAVRPAAEPAAGAGTGAAPEGYALLLWIQIEPDPLNPRKFTDADQPAIDELADSIARDGLLENLVVRPGQVPAQPVVFLHDCPAPMHRLVAGERRHRAIGRLIERGDWPQDRPILCKVADLDDAGHRRVALVENLQRKDLRPIDEARALKELMEVTGAGTAEVAAEIGFTQRFVQQRLQLLELPDALKEKVNAGELPVEDGRAAVGLWAKLPPIKQTEVLAGKTSVREAKAWLESQPKPLALDPIVWLTALEVYDAILRRPLKAKEYEYPRVEVGQAALTDEHLVKLKMHGILSGATQLTDKHYLETGRLYVSRQYDLHTQLERRFGGSYRGGGAPLQALLAQMRAEAGIAGHLDEGVYHTAWLNPPFEVPKEKAEKYAEELAKKRKAEADEKAAKEQARKAAEERKARAAEQAEVVDAIVRDLAARPPIACHADFAEALRLAGLPAPWRVAARAMVTAGDGTEIYYPSWQLEDRPEILHQRVLLVAAVNFAAGVAFSVEPEAEGEAA